MRELSIIADIDDVFFPWFTTAQRVCEDAGITNGVQASQWQMHKDYGCAFQQWADALSSATESGLLYAQPPIPGSLAALRRLQAIDARIHFVTARGFAVNGSLIRKHTVDWLERFKVPHDSLTFSKDKGIIPGDFGIDDNPGNVARMRDAGIRTYLMNAPHNQNVYDANRVFTVNQFVDHVYAYACPLGQAA